MKTRVLLAAALLALLPASLVAQEDEKKGGFEVNGGLSASVPAPGETVNSVGAGGEALLHYRVVNYVGLYGGWGYNAFRNEFQPAGHRCDFEETGYVLGLQYKRPVDSSGIRVFVRGGLQYKHIEIEDPSGELIFDTTHGFGWQLGCGVEFPLGENWSLVPEVRYNSLPANWGPESAYEIPDRNYYSVRMGILKKF